MGKYFLAVNNVTTSEHRCKDELTIKYLLPEPT